MNIVPAHWWFDGVGHRVEEDLTGSFYSLAPSRRQDNHPAPTTGPAWREGGPQRLCWSRTPGRCRAWELLRWPGTVHTSSSHRSRPLVPLLSALLWPQEPGLQWEIKGSIPGVTLFLRTGTLRARLQPGLGTGLKPSLSLWVSLVYVALKPSRGDGLLPGRTTLPEGGTPWALGRYPNIAL